MLDSRTACYVRGKAHALGLVQLEKPATQACAAVRVVTAYRRQQRHTQLFPYIGLVAIITAAAAHH